MVVYMFMGYTMMVKVSTDWASGGNVEQLKETATFVYQFSTSSTALVDFGKTLFHLTKRKPKTE